MFPFERRLVLWLSVAFAGLLCLTLFLHARHSVRLTVVPTESRHVL